MGTVAEARFIHRPWDRAWTSGVDTMNHLFPEQPIIGIKGAGEMATAIACCLFKTVSARIFMMETHQPMAVRREVSFSEAVHTGLKTVEQVPGVRCSSAQAIQEAWAQGCVAVIVDPTWVMTMILKPRVVIDAIIAKKNLGTTPGEAPLTIGLGPGFQAPEDVHLVIETNRGHNLGRIIESGSAEPNTGIPGAINGVSAQRVLRAPVSGVFQAGKTIGSHVTIGDIIGSVNGQNVTARVSGIIRGLLRSGTQVPAGIKLGDIDPRGEASFCHTISDKARTLAGAVLEGILRHRHRIRSFSDVSQANHEQSGMTVS